MKNFLTILLPAACCLLPAASYPANWLNFNTDTSPTTPAAATPTAEGSAATLRLLDKNTNRLLNIPLKAGASATSPLSITLRRCVPDVQGIPGQDVAWIDVTDPTSNASLYSGWMFNLYPDVATLEHPRYDLRLIGCTRTDIPKPSVGKKHPVDDSPATPVPDSEAPTDTEASTNDPNYVEGVGPESPPTPDALQNLIEKSTSDMPERPVAE